MKKSVLALAAIALLQAGSVSAAPLNELSAGETAVGFSSVDYYLEHQLSKNFTIGYQNADRDQYGDMDDIYGQFRLTDNLRVIAGSRDLPYDSANFYAGLGVNAPLTSNINGYAAYMAGSDFSEAQIGTNIALVSNVDFNINYHAFNPDHGKSENGFGFGATLKF